MEGKLWKALRSCVWIFVLWEVNEGLKVVMRMVFQEDR